MNTPDWKHWLNMSSVKMWQACALSLDIEPKKIIQSGDNWSCSYLTPDEKSQREFNDHLDILKSHDLTLRVSNTKADVSLAKVAKLGRSAHWEMPTEMQTMPEPEPPPESQLQGTRWPDHQTAKLAALRMAAVKWWAKYDPADPSTAPTNDEVSGWIHKQHNISKTIADAMASILRPDDLKPGPRPK